jgi:hypothetical protein
MEITLSLEDGPGGRLTGVARFAGPGLPESLPFSGNLELLAVLERLRAAAGPGSTPGPDADSTVTEQEH